MLASSPGYYVDFDSKADWDIAYLNAADGPLGHIVLITKSTELQEKCRPADVALTSSTVGVVGLALDRVSGSIAGGALSNDSSRGTA